MIDRNAVWAAAYGAAFERLLNTMMLADGWPDEVILEAIGDDAKTVADAAVKYLKEPESSEHIPSDSELLDEILEAGKKLSTPNAMARSIARSCLVDTVMRAIAERSKR